MLLETPDRVRRAVETLHAVHIPVSLFHRSPIWDRLRRPLNWAWWQLSSIPVSYALAQGAARERELNRLVAAGERVNELGLKLHAGHGLNYLNVQPIASIAGMRELNIGHSIVARAVFVGLRDAVAEMKQLIVQATSK